MKLHVLQHIILTRVWTQSAYKTPAILTLMASVVATIASGCGQTLTTLTPILGKEYSRIQCSVQFDGKLHSPYIKRNGPAFIELMPIDTVFSGYMKYDINPYLDEYASPFEGVFRDSSPAQGNIRFELPDTTTYESALDSDSVWVIDTSPPHPATRDTVTLVFDILNPIASIQQTSGGIGYFSDWSQDALRRDDIIEAQKSVAFSLRQLSLTDPDSPGATTGYGSIKRASFNCQPILACKTPDPSKVLHDVVRDYSATSDNDADDDSEAIQQALSCADKGDTVYFPSGLYHVDQTLYADQEITIRGEPLRSGLFQRNKDVDLLKLAFASNAEIRDLLLSGVTGSSATQPALLRLFEMKAPHVENVYFYGGHTGIAIQNSETGIFKKMSGAENHPLGIDRCGNYQGGGPRPYTCSNQQWVLIDDSNRQAESKASMSHLFINPIFEGAVAGIKHIGGANSIGWSMVGGVFSTHGVPGPMRNPTAIEISGTTEPILIKGMHIEGNRVVLENTNNVWFESNMISGVEKTTQGRFCVRGRADGLRIWDSSLEALDVGPDLDNPGMPIHFDNENNRFGTAGTCKHSGVPAPNLCENYRTALADQVLDGC